MTRRSEKVEKREERGGRRRVEGGAAIGSRGRMMESIGQRARPRDDGGQVRRRSIGEVGPFFVKASKRRHPRAFLVHVRLDSGFLVVGLAPHDRSLLRQNQTFPTIERNPARRLVARKTRFMARLASIAKESGPLTLVVEKMGAPDDHRVRTMVECHEKAHQGSTQ